MAFLNFILKEYKYAFILTCWLWLLSASLLFAQTAPTIVIGKVIDAISQDPLIGVSVYFQNSQIGTATDLEGNYILKTTQPLNQLQFSYLGYKTISHTITTGQSQEINIKLEANATALNEVVIKGKRGRYKNKNNPAVDLIHQVITHKSENRLSNFNYAEYEQYEKMQFALTNTPEKLHKNILLRKFPFLIQNLDTTTLKEMAVLPYYLQEVVSQHYYRKSPEKKKTIVKAEKKVDFGEYLDTKGVNQYFNHLYKDIDIYQNNISVLTNEFLSPIADMAPTFYRFFISDTLVSNGEKLIELSFRPRNNTDFLFSGQLYITQDDKYAVKKVEMEVNKSVNINWVRDLKINLDFDKDNQGNYNLSKSEMRGSFGIFTKGAAGMYGTRTIHFKNYKFNRSQPDAIYEGLAVEPLSPAVAQAQEQDEKYWQATRPDTLTTAEANTYSNIETLKNSRTFKRTADWLTTFVAGYKKAGPYLEIGPVSTFYSFNPVEGFRLRFGGRTTNTFSKKINLESYVAYGFKDEKVKYYLGGTYSFTDRSIFEFPVRSLRISYQQDTKIPGQESQFVQESNILLSFKRGANDKWLYNKTFNIDYLHEYANHFSYRFGLKRVEQSPAGGLVYQKVNAEGVMENIPALTTSELMVEFRWAPYEKFFQGKIYRTPFIGKYPVFTLRGVAGIKGLLDGQYNYQNVTLNIFKRVGLSQFGYTDVVAEGGYSFGVAPYPLLTIHRANQTYAYQLQSYNLMNFQEFVSDHYASLLLDHTFNGFIFNKIPIIKKTNLREYASVKILYGGLRKENQSLNNLDLLRFQVDNQGNPLTYTLEKKPYIEGSIGIGNIFKFFRVDLVKRFTYLDHNNISDLGLRGQFKFDF